MPSGRRSRHHRASPVPLAYSTVEADHRDAGSGVHAVANSTMLSCFSPAKPCCGEKIRSKKTSAPLAVKQVRLSGISIGCSVVAEKTDRSPGHVAIAQQSIRPVSTESSPRAPH